MISAEQLVAHAIGDYVVQSDWMATEKTKRWFPALLHGVTYAAVFVWFTHDWWRLAVIAATHTIIDRFRLARYLCWAKNWVFGGPRLPWAECRVTGYPDTRAQWMTVWLMIVADNICHVLINGWVL